MQKDFNEFKEKLGQSESNGNYKAIQKITGCLGKFQFSKNRLLDFGITDTEEFLNNPELQEKIFKRHAKDIIDYVIKNLLSSLVAMAHLGGKQGTKNFVLSGTNTRDVLGTSLLTYSQKFQGYDLSELVFEDKNKEIAGLKGKITDLEKRIANLKENKKELLKNNLGLIKQVILNLREKLTNKKVA